MSSPGSAAPILDDRSKARADRIAGGLHFLAGMILLPAIAFEAADVLPPSISEAGGYLPPVALITGLLLICGAAGLRYGNFLWLGYGCSVLPPSEMTPSPRRDRISRLIGGVGVMLALGTIGYWLASLASS